MTRTIRQHRIATALVSLVAAVCYLLAGAHYALVVHQVCAEHAQLSHGDHDHHASPHEPASRADTHSDTETDVTLRALPHSDGAHGHCDLEAVSPNATADGATFVALPEAGLAPEIHLEDSLGAGGVPLLSLAPKRAPPILVS